MPNSDNNSRMSNTAEILTKQFRDAMRQSNLHDLEGIDRGWQWKRFKEEALNFFVSKSTQQNTHRNSTKSEGSSSNISASSGGGVNELFPKYRMRLQNNFFVSLLILNILFNGIVIVVALLEKVRFIKLGQFNLNIKF